MAVVRTFLLCCSLLLILGSRTFAAAPQQEEFLRELQARSQAIDSIGSDFIQQSHIALFADVIESRGKFSFVRPDYLRWEYTAPFVSGFRLKGRQGVRWDGAADKVTTFSTEKSPEMAIISEQILAWTTMNIPFIQSLYNIKVTSFSPAIMELTPKSEGAKQFLSLIRIFFSRDASHLQSIELHEPGGDYTEISFSNVKLNQKTDQNILLKE